MEVWEKTGRQWRIGNRRVICCNKLKERHLHPWIKMRVTVSFSCGKHCRLKGREFVLCFKDLAAMQEPRTSKAYLVHSFFHLIIEALKSSFWTHSPVTGVCSGRCCQALPSKPHPLSYEMTPPPDHMLKAFAEVPEEGRLLVEGKQKGVSKPGPGGQLVFFSAPLKIALNLF